MTSTKDTRVREPWLKEEDKQEEKFGKGSGG
jgi:hypothetical protein